jgi:Ca-activated chloride channel family protein
MQSLFSQDQWQFWLPAALAALAALAWILRWYERRRKLRLHRVVEAQLAPRLLYGYDARVRQPLFWLTLLGVAALLAALAQPRWGETWVEVEKRSRDVLVLLDVSESMNAPDPKPTRLQRARQKIESLVEMAPADRFGLIAYAGASELQCPLTLDHNYFRAVLDAVDTNTLSAEGTDLAAALREAVAVFEEDAKSGQGGEGSRAILIVSDGEVVSGSTVQAAARAREVADVFALAIGSEEGATVMRPDWMRNAMGGATERTHHSTLDAATLQGVVSASDGFTMLTGDNSDIARLFGQFDSLSARSVSGTLRERMTNRYQWPLALAMVCFAGEGLWIVLMPHLRTWRMRKRKPSAATEVNHA